MWPPNGIRWNHLLGVQQALPDRAALLIWERGFERVAMM